jgi:hypothetical protein
MNTKIIFAILFFSWVSMPLLAQQQGTLKNMHEKKWQQFIDEHIKQGSDVKMVDKILNNFSRDKISMFLGGTGAYYRYYLIDDFIQIKAEFDKNDILASVPTIEPLQKWRKLPDGTGVMDTAPAKGSSIQK